MRKDYLYHIIAGGLITLIAAYLINKFWMRDYMLMGALAGILAGFFKEVIWDWYLERGDPDGNDFYATFWGSLTFGILAYFIF